MPSNILQLQNLLRMETIKEMMIITFDNRKQMDDAIVCSTSTAEEMASLIPWTSACSRKETECQVIKSMKQRTT